MAGGKPSPAPATTTTNSTTDLGISRLLAQDVIPALSHTMRTLGSHSTTLLWGAAGLIAPASKPPPLLPPAGLDESAAQALWFTLLQAAACHAHSQGQAMQEAHAALSTEPMQEGGTGGEGVAAAASAEVQLQPQPQLLLLHAPAHWLQALQAAHAASDRLQLDLQEVAAALRFWRGHLRRGSEGAHARFLLLGRGPAAFLRSLANLLSRLVDALLTPGSWLLPPTAFTQSQPQLHTATTLQSAGSGALFGAPGLSAGAGAGAVAPWEHAFSSTNQLQQRVLVLEQLQAQLAAALARVHRAAAPLWLLPDGPSASVSLLAPRLAQLMHSGSLSRSYTAAAAAAAVQPQGSDPGSGGAASAMGAAAPRAAVPRLERDPNGAAAAASHSAALLLRASDAARSCAAGVRRALDDAQAGTSWVQHCAPPASASLRPSYAASATPGAPLFGPDGHVWYIRGLAALSRLLQPPAPSANLPPPSGGSFSRGLSRAPPLCPAMFGLSPWEQGPIADILLGRGGAEESAEAADSAEMVPEEQGTGIADATRPVSLPESGSQHAASTSAAASGQQQQQQQDQQQRGSVAGALCAARAAAADAPALVSLPPWLRMPSALQRNWLSYLLRGASAAWALRFLYLHSRLSGSTDLERWASEAAQAVAGAWTTHVAEPLANVRAELFHTFRDRPSIVTQAEFDADQQSLARMLHDFAKDKGMPSAATAAAVATAGSGLHTGAPPTASKQPINAPAGSAMPTANGNTTSSAGGNTPCNTQAAGAGSILGRGTPSNTTAATLPAPTASTAAPVPQAESAGAGSSLPMDLAGGMQLVMRSYEDELRNPLRNLVIGDLARAMLIQVQRLKLDTEAAMLQLDQILRASELSISLMAALPALLLTWAGLAAAVRWLTPRAPDVKKDAVPLRLAGAQTSSALQLLLRQQQAWERAAAAASSGPGAGGYGWVAGQGLDAGDAEGEVGCVETLLAAEGMVLYRLSCMYRETELLYRHYDRTSHRSEYPPLVADLQLLARLAVDPSGQGAKDMAPMLQHVLRTYRAFQQPA